MLDLFLNRLRNTMGFKLCLFLGFSILVGVVLFSLYAHYYLERVLLDNAKNELIDLSGIIMRNTRRSMQSNYPEGIEDIIKTAGEQKTILSVRIYDRGGRINYSSDSPSKGMTIDISDPSCEVCHVKGRTDIPRTKNESIFSGNYQGQKSIAIVAPIFGDPSCYEAPCHHHPPEHTVIGILEIHRSPSDVEAVVAGNVRRTGFFGVAVFLLISSITVFFVIRFVQRPVRNLVDSATRLSRGEYGQAIPVEREDELGRLTSAFNEMSRRIEDREKKLFKSREEFRTLFNEVPASIVVLNDDLTIRNTNRVYRDRYGDRIGQPCLEMRLGRKELCEGCPAIETLSDGLVHSCERIEKQPDGKEHTFLVHTAPIRDEDGYIESVMEISTDVTSIKELQIELASLGETIAGISHSIKNILQGLEGGMHVVQIGSRKDDTDILLKGWNMVEGNVKRVSGLVRDILFLSRERKPELVDTDPAQVCRDVAELVIDRATTAGIGIELEIPENAGTVRIDPKGLHTVLLNLMGNAVDACSGVKSPPPHQKVALKYSYDTEGHILFEVADNGPGMSSETKDMVFKRFFSTKGSAGTGLGLLVTRKIVEEHGGQIGFQSELGEGTVFTVRFPVGDHETSK